MNVVFFGSSKFVIPIIDVLRKNFSAKGGLVLVVTTEKNPTNPIPSYCINYKIPYLSVSNLSDASLKSLIINHKSLIAVLADFGLFIPNDVLNLFPKGIINIHPSLLPKYRGPTPVQTAIYSGEKETGVTIIKLDEEIDHGPILAQEKEEILPQDTAQSLYERLFRKGGQILPNVINKYLSGNLSPMAQNHKNASYTNPLTRQNGFININNPPPPEVLNRIVRAYFPWPGVWSTLKIKNQELRIKFLPDKKIQIEGKKPMNYKDFINGYPTMDKELFSKLHLLDNSN